MRRARCAGFSRKMLQQAVEHARAIRLRQLGRETQGAVADSGLSSASLSTSLWTGMTNWRSCGSILIYPLQYERCRPSHSSASFLSAKQSGSRRARANAGQEPALGRPRGS